MLAGEFSIITMNCPVLTENINSLVDLLSSQTHTHTLSHTHTLPLSLTYQFSSIPDYYDSVYVKLTRQGARVLALGYKHLGSLSLREVRAPLTCRKKLSL